MVIREFEYLLRVALTAINQKKKCSNSSLFRIYSVTFEAKWKRVLLKSNSFEINKTIKQKHAYLKLKPGELAFKYHVRENYYYYNSQNIFEETHETLESAPFRQQKPFRRPKHISLPTRKYDSHLTVVSKSPTTCGLALTHFLYDSYRYGKVATI